MIIYTASHELPCKLFNRLQKKKGNIFCSYFPTLFAFPNVGVICNDDYIWLDTSNAVYFTIIFQNTCAVPRYFCMGSQPRCNCKCSKNI